MSDLPKNLHVEMNEVISTDAFDYLRHYGGTGYDIITESNMLNNNEHVDDDYIDDLIENLNKSLEYFGKAVLVEPADESAEFMKKIAERLAGRNDFTLTRPRTEALDVSDVKLFSDACKCGLRDKKENKHYFVYTVFTKQRRLS